MDSPISKIKSLIKQYGNKESDVSSRLSEYMSEIMTEAEQVSTFAGYDVGLGQTLEAIGNDGKQDPSKTSPTTTEKFLAVQKVCNDFDLGILNQGMFQQRVLNQHQWMQMKQWYSANKTKIKRIHFFHLSTSLEDSVSPITNVLPVLNLYHTGVGMTFEGEDEHGKPRIIRSAIMQLEFGELKGLSDAVDRFLAPQFCMGAVFDDNNKQIPPLKLNDKEFAKNLYIDYSKSVSALMFNFLEKTDNVTQELVDSMQCVSMSDLASSAPVPYSGFLKQNMTMKDMYDAYNLQHQDMLDKKMCGPADGTIFCLSGFGPSPFTSQAGCILHFASTTDASVFDRLLDWSFSNYGQCSTGPTNNLHFYCIAGVDKITPVKNLSPSCIRKELQKPNIISADNGYIREARGRTTHCNTLAAVFITTLDHVFKPENPSEWSWYTDFESEEVQSFDKYMLNPAIPNFPCVEFPKGWEYGVSIEEFNFNKDYIHDKRRFYRLFWFIRTMAKGLQTAGDDDVLPGSLGNNEFFRLILDMFQSSTAKTLVTHLCSRKTNHRYEYSYITLLGMLSMYIIVHFKLFKDLYWATGQPCVTGPGKYNINVTDSMPTIFRIEVAPNAEIMKSYILAFFERTAAQCGMDTQSIPRGMPQTAGDIYANESSTKDLFVASEEQILKWFHPFPLNRFFLWFPGVKLNNECALANNKLLTIETFVPEIKYYHNNVDVKKAPPKPKCQVDPGADRFSKSDLHTSNKEWNALDFVLIAVSGIILLVILSVFISKHRQAKLQSA